jgi:predicted nucleotidyltransferase
MGQAARLFNGNVEQTLIGRVTPTPDQREFLQVQWNALAAHLKAQLFLKRGYVISTWLQGSYKYGTLIKPVHAGEEYDVDVGVYFEWDNGEDAEPTARQLRDWLHEELYAYKRLNGDVRSIEEPPRERCSRAAYERQFHIDTPVYHLNSGTDVRRLACLSDKWEDSDPKALYKWFRDAVHEGDREQLRRLVRYMKAWAAVSFDNAPGSRPSSILLTVLTTEAYQSIWPTRVLGVSDDDALVAIIKRVYARLNDDDQAPSPVDPDENLNRLEGEAWEGFLHRLQALVGIAERADEAPDEAAAALTWSEAFSFLMPLPETDQVEVVDERSGTAVMLLPEIDVEVYSRDPKAFVARHRNEVPGVAKNCDLVFKIVNDHIVPDYATVEWTVRNEGAEADLRSDLGHRRIGVRNLSADEHTAYIGRHFMDCVIRLDGQVYAVRRVPVTVRDVLRPQRNPPRPAYTKIRSTLRRR